MGPSWRLYAAVPAVLVVASWVTTCLEPLPDAQRSEPDASSQDDSSSGGGAGLEQDGASFDASNDEPSAETGNPCVAAGAFDYELKHLPKGATYGDHAQCSEVFWADVPILPVLVQGDTGNPSDNTATCKLAWSNDPSPTVWGCCEIQDADVIATHPEPDPLGEPWRDDSVELLMKLGESPTYDNNAQKTIVSAADGYRDSKWTNGIFDPSYDSQLLHNALVELNRYKIKWRADLAYAVIPGQLARCDLTVHDVEAPDANANLSPRLVAFGADHTGDMATAGVCRFGCPP